MFRPADCVPMARAIAAIVSFVEEPSIGGPGSRHMPLPLLITTLSHAKAGLPDIGFAPRALLLHALERAFEGRRPVTATPLSDWLNVSDLAHGWGSLSADVLLTLASLCGLASSVVS